MGSYNTVDCFKRVDLLQGAGSARVTLTESTFASPRLSTKFSIGGSVFTTTTEVGPLPQTASSVEESTKARMSQPVADPFTGKVLLRLARGFTVSLSTAAWKMERKRVVCDYYGVQAGGRYTKHIAFLMHR